MFFNLVCISWTIKVFHFYCCDMYRQIHTVALRSGSTPISLQPSLLLCVHGVRLATYCSCIPIILCFSTLYFLICKCTGFIMHHYTIKWVFISA